MEQEYPEDGTTFGCATIYGALLMLTGIVVAVYVLLDGVPLSVADVLGGEVVMTTSVLVAALVTVAVGAGLWYEQLWARVLVLFLHVLAALLGLGVALLPLVAGANGGPVLAGLATPATALMGVVVNVVIVAWLWRSWQPEDDEHEP
jgi:hypothetical protein